MFRKRLAPFVLVIELLFLPTGAIRLCAAEGASSPSGTVRLPSGHRAFYEYHFNRNAIRDSQVAGQNLIALTESGNLLRFDVPSLKLTNEWYGIVPITCLGRGAGGSMLAGFADGRLCRVDPATLAPTEILRLESKPQWVAERAAEGAAARIVAVLEKTKHVDWEWYHGPVAYSMVQDLASGKTFALEKAATAFFQDSKGRLWLGEDHGEWGGWVSVCDLAAGTLRSIPGRKILWHAPDQEFWPGVFGFFERHDGQVWAYGGTTHMFSTNGYIWRADRDRAEELYYLDNVPPGRKEELKREMAEARAKEENEAKAKAEAQAREEKEAKEKGTTAPGTGKYRYAIPPEIDEPVPAVDPKKMPGQDPEREPEPEPLPADRPHLPITHIVERPRTHDLLVLSFSDVYQADPDLKRWSKVHELGIRYRGGRRDAVGTYPSVHSVHFLEATDQLILGTRLDGFLRLEGNQKTAAALPGQLEVEWIARIENTKEGMLVVESNGGDLPWQLQKAKWIERDFAPRIEKAPAKKGVVDPDEAEGSRLNTRLLVGVDGSFFTVSEGMWTPGLYLTARWHNGKSEILGQEHSDLVLDASFVTPDGKLWNTTHNSVRRFANGQWQIVFAEDQGSKSVDRLGLGWGLRAIPGSEPPWILLDRRNKRLVSLQPDPKRGQPPIVKLPILEGGHTLEIHDAIPWTSGTILLATNQGLRAFATASAQLSRPALPALDRQIQRLCRDGLGRLWMGGEGLIMIDPDGKTVHVLDSLPMLGRSSIDELAADAAHCDGIVAAMGKRGLIFVQARSSPD